VSGGEGAPQSESLGPLLPCKPGVKYPNLRNWTKMSPETLGKIMDKARAKPHNVALRLDNYVTLDPDSEAAEEFLMSLHRAGVLPLTVTWRTAGRGLTAWLYRPPNGQEIKGIREDSNDLKLGIRTGKKQCCTIPPSTFKDRRYEWIVGPEHGVAELPPSALTRIVERLGRSQRQSRGKGNNKAEGLEPVAPIPPLKPEEPASTIPDGQRNNTLFRLGCGMRAWGHSRKTIEDNLSEINRAKCNPPLEPGEVAGIAKRAGRYPININLYTLKARREDVVQALERLGGRENGVRGRDLVNQLEADTGCCARTAWRAIKRAKAKGLIIRRKRRYKISKKLSPKVRGSIHEHFLP